MRAFFHAPMYSGDVQSSQDWRLCEASDIMPSSAVQLAIVVYVCGKIYGIVCRLPTKSIIRQILFLFQFHTNTVFIFQLYL